MGSGDFNIPAQGQRVALAIATLVQNVERLKLNFEKPRPRSCAEPGPAGDRADLMSLAKGRK
jgi:hypothetical protein